MNAGPLTLHCQACKDHFDLPLTMTAAHQSGNEWALSLHVDDGDIILMQIWGQAHRGPIGP